MTKFLLFITFSLFLSSLNAPAYPESNPISKLQGRLSPSTPTGYKKIGQQPIQSPKIPNLPSKNTQPPKHNWNLVGWEDSKPNKIAATPPKPIITPSDSKLAKSDKFADRDLAVKNIKGRINKSPSTEASIHYITNLEKFATSAASGHRDFAVRIQNELIPAACAKLTDQYIASRKDVEEQEKLRFALGKMSKELAKDFILMDLGKIVPTTDNVLHERMFSEANRIYQDSANRLAQVGVQRNFFERQSVSHCLHKLYETVKQKPELFNECLGVLRFNNKKTIAKAFTNQAKLDFKAHFDAFELLSNRIFNREIRGASQHEFTRFARKELHAKIVERYHSGTDEIKQAMEAYGYPDKLTRRPK